MRTLRFLLQKEFRQIFRNPSILRMMLVVPIVQLLILPLAADFEIRNINVAIVDHDHSTYSRALVNKIIASGYFRLSAYGESYQDAFSGFEKDKSDLILEIPKDFEKDMTVNQEAGLLLAVNAINGMKASVGSSYMSRIINNYNADIRLQWLLLQR
jgi:ABC-2 type transport system permease protein